ncbi:MAG TPA: hypothetical protein VLD58_02355 [Gemmatimonadales bacterium]|nr:hypothetical protein [Gemmatimonadales bacterium]
MTLLLLSSAAFAPNDCILTGLCGVRVFEPGVPAGLMFVALGLVLGGAIGLRRARRRS